MLRLEHGSVTPRPFRKLWQTIQSTNRPTKRPTDQPTYWPGHFQLHFQLLRNLLNSVNDVYVNSFFLFFKNFDTDGRRREPKKISKHIHLRLVCVCLRDRPPSGPKFINKQRKFIPFYSILKLQSGSKIQILRHIGPTCFRDFQAHH